MRPDAGLHLGGNTPTALRFSHFHFCSVMAFVSPCPVHPPYTLFELPPFLTMASPLPPRAVCLGRPPRLVHTLSPQSPWPFGRAIFPSCMFSVPPEVPPFPPPLSSSYHYIKQRSLAAGRRTKPEGEHATWKALSVSSQRSSDRDVTSLSRKLGKSCSSPLPHH